MAATPRAPESLVGILVNGRYRVRDTIAEGGMGRVYAATDERVRRPVALKVVRDGADDPVQWRERFRVETAILGKLQHPNIVTLLDRGVLQEPFGAPFLVMELLTGETLEQRLAGHGPSGPAEVLGVAAQIARALRALHAAGVVHRDLKPSNVMLVPELDGEEIVKLVDFGVGRLLAEREGLTRSGTSVGTPEYMSPEQLEGRSAPSSDLYALGLLMFESLTGQLPFDSASGDGAIYARLARRAPALRDVAPGIESFPELDALIAKLLEREPRLRPTASSALADIRQCQMRIAARATESVTLRPAPPAPAVATADPVERVVLPAPRRASAAARFALAVASILASAAAGALVTQLRAASAETELRTELAEHVVTVASAAPEVARTAPPTIRATPITTATAVRAPARPTASASASAKRAPPVPSSSQPTDNVFSTSN